MSVSETMSAESRFGYPLDVPNRQIVRRSSLIMPVNVPKFVAKAHLRGADAIVLDLEDSVPPQEKDRARTLVKSAIAEVGRGGADVLVRVNRPWVLQEAGSGRDRLAGTGRHQLPEAGDGRGVSTHRRGDHAA